MHVLDLKPFQVGLGHIGFIGHHGVKLVWPTTTKGVPYTPSDFTGFWVNALVVVNRNQ